MLSAYIVEYTNLKVGNNIDKKLDYHYNNTK